VLSDLILLLVRERIARVIGCPSADGGAGDPHYRRVSNIAALRFLRSGSAGTAKDADENGQRVLTFVIYLNDDYTEGETDFPRLNWRFRGRKGDALFWWSVDPAGNPIGIRSRWPVHAGWRKVAVFPVVRDRPGVLYR